MTFCENEMGIKLNPCYKKKMKISASNYTKHAFIVT